MKTLLKLLALSAMLALPTGCTGGDDDDDDDEIGYVQIERLGRPAINEALLVSNEYLNAFNSISPNLDLTASTDLLNEAIGTLNALDSLDGEDDVDATAIAGAFLPDVMRIDTTLAISTSASSFAAATGGSLGILTGGRKIEDDVVDVYYTVLIGTTTGTNPDLAGYVGPVGDGVRYEGYPGVNEAQPGHKMLHGASAYNSAATFPFLATPN